MVAVVAESEHQAREIAKSNVKSELADPSWVSGYLAEIENAPFASITDGECIAFGNWVI